MWRRGIKVKITTCPYSSSKLVIVFGYEQQSNVEFQSLHPSHITKYTQAWAHGLTD
jgi:hypothetical protein